LANNHFYDNLEKDFQNTINFLEENSIYHIDSSITGNEGEPYIFEKKGIKVAVLNYVTKDTNPNLLNDAKVRPNWFYLKKVEEDIAKLKDKVDYIIVYPHWGGRMEGAKLPDRELIPIAHKIIDAGADLIIGHHSPTIQPYEIYKGKYIFYSLGNFCFSDLISDGRISYLERKRGLKGAIVSVVFTTQNYHYIQPFIISLAENKITRLSARRIAYIIILLPFLIYFGFRLNPSLNPERKLWGSFDINYGLNYALSYSGVSEEQLESTYAQGRWGASWAILKNTVMDPLDIESFFGFGRSRGGYINIDTFDPQDYGLLPDTMISSIGIMIVQMGWSSTLILILLFLNMIYTIPDKRTANIIAFYVLWDLIFYSGSMINATVQSLLLVLVIIIISSLHTNNIAYTQSRCEVKPYLSLKYNKIGIQ